MEEKTAKIPSLKDFKESRKERDAHAQRSSSMQTKKQMEKSMKKSKREKTPKNNVGRQSREDVSSTRKLSTSSERPRRSSQSSRPQQDERKNREQSAEQVTRRRRPDESNHQQRQRTYVRDTLNNPQGIDNLRGEDYSSEPLRQYRSQNSREAQRRRASSAPPRRGAKSTPVRRNSPQRRPASSPQKAFQKPQKPRKPMTPGMRKFRNVMIYVALIVAVVAVGAVLSLTVLFKTEEIVVTGNGKYSQEEIIEASGLVMGENIFTAPKRRAASKIEKAYPYIAQANVHATFPNAITIDLTMAQPAYMLESSGSYYTVSDKGKVLSVSATDDEAKVPVIEGLEVKGKAAGEYLEYESDIITTALEEIFAAFRQLGCENITAVNVETSEGGTVKFRYVYDNRIVVYLGAPDHLSYKIHTADTIIREKLDVGTNTVAGELDVSKSYETKKSYFNEYTILADNVAPVTIPEGSAPTEAVETTAAEEYYEEPVDEYSYNDTYEDNYDESYEDGYYDESGENYYVDYDQTYE